MRKLQIFGVFVIFFFLNATYPILGTSSTPEENIYASYYGGSDRDVTTDIAINSLGQFILVGGTFSSDFPLIDGFQAEYGGGAHEDDIHLNGGDGFIMKLDANGNIIWSTFFGGSELEEIEAVEIDNEDNIFIIGTTTSLDFPTTENASQQIYGGGEVDGFIAKISNAGNLLYSSYVGKNASDRISDIKIDSLGNVVTLGTTEAATWEVTANAMQENFGGNSDILVHKYTNALTETLMCSYWGTEDFEGVYSLELDADDSIYMAGYIIGENLPLKNAPYTDYGGVRDGFVAKINNNNTLEFSTYLGGESFEDLFGSTIDSQGNYFVSGRTDSPDFPVVNELQSNFSNNVDGIITVFEAEGQEISFSSYFGGWSFDTIHDLCTTDDGYLYACGIAGPEFPLERAMQEEPNGGEVNFIMMVLDSNYQLIFSSYFGNNRGMTPYAIESYQDQMVIVGRSNSGAVPVSDDAAYSTNSGDDDGFIIMFDVVSYLSSDSSISNAPNMFYLLSFLSICWILVIKSKK